MSTPSLRTYAFVDRMQPQCAAHIAATSPGDVPLAGMAELYIEMAPGNEVFRAADIALKAAGVRPALQIIEREFGLLEIHSEQQAEVLASGQAVLDSLGLVETDRIRPTIASTQFITNVHPYQAQLLNKWRKGSMLMPGQSLFVMEVAPAAYIAVAARWLRSSVSRQYSVRAPVRRGQPTDFNALIDWSRAGGRGVAAPQACRNPDAENYARGSKNGLTCEAHYIDACRTAG